MKVSAALEIELRAFRDLVRLLATSSTGARLLELEGGILGSLVPAAPRRSIVNSVIYRDPAALAASLPELQATYEEGGIETWTVWAPEFDDDAIAALEGAGHELDGEPPAMIAELDGLALPAPDGLDWDAEASMQTLGELNDRAYGLASEDGFSAALALRPDLPLHLYQARVGSQPACALATIDHPPTAGAAGPDCGVYLVATDPEHRGQGLATRLLAAALEEARARGCATSSLQSSAMAASIYAGLGYHRHFRFRMYERRLPRTSPP